MAPAAVRLGLLNPSSADRRWLLRRETCANALHNLDCAAGLEMWPLERARPGVPCPRFERCVWQTAGGDRLTWSGTVPAGPPTQDFLEGVLAGMRVADTPRRATVTGEGPGSSSPPWACAR